MWTKIITAIANWLWPLGPATEAIPQPKKPEQIIAEIPLKPKYIWSDPISACHSVRAICDEEKLNYAEKNLIAQVVNAESGFKPHVIGKINSNGTQDFGLCQYNNGKNSKGVPYWIGEGATFKDVDEVLSDPEKNVRVMVKTFRQGKLSLWSSYKSGAYLKYESKLLA